MDAESRKVFFLIAAAIGVVVTWYFNIQFALESKPPSISTFITGMCANSAAASISNDLLVVVNG
jgi:hypothetical protein